MRKSEESLIMFGVFKFARVLRRSYRKSVILALTATFFTGCFVIRDNSSEWIESTDAVGKGGNGAPDAVLMQWREEQICTDNGRKIAIGLIPGAGEMWQEGCIIGSSHGIYGTGNREHVGSNWFLWGYYTTFMQLFAGIPTILSVSSCFTSGIDESGGAGSELTSYGLLGCHRWKVESLGTRKIKDGESEEFLVKSDRSNAETLLCVVPNSKMRDGVKYYIGYPGYDNLYKDVSESGKVEVVYYDVSSNAVCRTFRKANHGHESLAFIDKRVDSSDERGLQLKAWTDGLQIIKRCDVVKGHDGYRYLNDDSKNQLRELKADVEDRISTMCSQHNASVADLNIRCAKLERSVADVWEKEVQRRAAEEAARVSKKKEVILKLLADQKYEDAVKECDSERESDPPWSEFKSKAKRAILERDRKVELTRIEQRKKEILKLLKEKQYAIAIAECDKETGRSNGSKPEDSIVWAELRAEAQKAEEAERLAKYRPQELLRINKKKELLDELLKKEKYDEVLVVCGLERGTSDGSLHEDAEVWAEYKRKAWMALTNKMEELLSRKAYSSVTGFCEQEIARTCYSVQQIKYLKQIKRKAWAAKRDLIWPSSWPVDKCEARERGGGVWKWTYTGMRSILHFADVYPKKGFRYQVESNFLEGNVGKIEVCSDGVIVAGEEGSGNKKIFVYTDHEYVDGMPLRAGWYGCVGRKKTWSGTMFCFVELSPEDYE